MKPRTSKRTKMIDLLVNSGKIERELNELSDFKLKKMLSSAQNEPALFTKSDTVSAVEQTPEITDIDIPVKPLCDTDPGWSDYVISQLTDKECKDGMPTCDGLRRIFKKLVGRTQRVGINITKSPTSADPTATVICSVTFVRHSGEVETIEDAFDVNPDNTPWPYCKASVATAATKAEARVLRKALGLVKVYALEEVNQSMSRDDIDPMQAEENKSISDSAKIAINTMCNRLSIDTTKLLKFMGTNVDNINVLSYKQSHEVIALLNSFTRGEINGGQSVPQNIKGEVIF